MLPIAALPVFGTVAQLSSELGYLTFLMRSYSTWGVFSKVGTRVDIIPFAVEVLS